MLLHLTVISLTMSIVAGAVLEISESNPKKAEAAKKCCPESAYECCYDLIEFHHRLECSAIAKEEEEDVMRCIQNELHGEADTNRTSINHISCCDVFLYDDTDPNNRCYQGCRFVLNCPSMPSKLKLHYIKSCRMQNDLNSCFNLCRAEHNDHTSKGFAMNEFKFLEPDTCGRMKMKEGELYPLNQIMRRL